ncbi:hypothetical protein C0J52_20494 [Blattella germanica]|nr:hypothetical protein C0J52_20494 [Blattella germanica]
MDDFRKYQLQAIAELFECVLGLPEIMSLEDSIVSLCVFTISSTNNSVETGTNFNSVKLTSSLFGNNQSNKEQLGDTFLKFSELPYGLKQENIEKNRHGKVFDQVENNSKISIRRRKDAEAEVLNPPKKRATSKAIPMIESRITGNSHHPLEDAHERIPDSSHQRDHTGEGDINAKFSFRYKSEKRYMENKHVKTSSKSIQEGDQENGNS